MTFSIIQIEDRVRKIIGTVWAPDEAGARAMAPMLAGPGDSHRFDIERSQDREIPFHFTASDADSPR
jgi:hypothetical protein